MSSVISSAAPASAKPVLSGVVVAGGTLVISGQDAIDTTVVTSSALVLSGQDPFPYTVGIDGAVILTSGTMTNTTLTAGEYYDSFNPVPLDVSQTIDAGGIASNTTLWGAVLFSQIHIDSPALFFSAIASQTVASGGSAVNVAMNGQVAGVVENGGVVSHVTLSGTSTPIEYSSDYQIASSFLVAAPQEIIQGGGVVQDATIGSYATVSAMRGATLSGVTLDGGLLRLDSGAIVDGPVVVNSGGIEFSDLPFEPELTLTYSGGVLTLSEPGQTRQIAISENHFGTPSYFAAAPDGRGTDVVFGTMCYAEGTLIEAEAGPCAVEALEIGQMVRTAGGALRPIRWIGRRSYDPLFARGNRDLLPVTVRQGALAPVLGAPLPTRDLTLSPLHAIFLDGVLVPVLHLVNGETIVQDLAPARIAYVHVELETHDLLLAEGTPAESFLDEGDRAGFQNAHEYARLYPDAQRPAPVYCAPRIEDGPLLASLRARLEARRCMCCTVDIVEPHRIEGWAFVHDERPLLIDAILDGHVIASAVCDRPRPDVAAHAAWMPEACGFAIGLPPGLDDRALARIVLREQGGLTIAHAPPAARHAA